MPAVRTIGPNTSTISFDGPQIAPAMTRPCPSRYLVPEWMTRSAPSSAGRCNAGEQKQLSTASSAPAPCASSASAAMSHTSVSGLVGVSANSRRVFGPQRRAPFRQVGLRHEAGLDAELAELLAEQIERGAEHRARADHMVARLQQAHAHHQDRAHAAGRADGRLGAFERRQALLEAGHASGWTCARRCSRLRCRRNDAPRFRRRAARSRW